MDISSLTICLSTFLTVFLLAFQQQNVQHGLYLAAAGTSVAIAAAQYVMISSVIQGGSWILMGLGGAAGVTLSMLIHRKYMGKKK